MSVTIEAGRGFALRVLERTVAANLPATPITIDYHPIIGRFIEEIFHHVLIIVGVAPTIKLASFPLLAGHSGRLEGHSICRRLERHRQTER